ncbi:hypothetical protein STANM309S_05187 [Streptomyces tanashiensis]
MPNSGAGPGEASCCRKRLTRVAAGVGRSSEMSTLTWMVVPSPSAKETFPAGNPGRPDGVRKSSPLGRTTRRVRPTASGMPVTSAFRRAMSIGSAIGPTVKVKWNRQPLRVSGDSSTMESRAAWVPCSVTRIPYASGIAITVPLTWPKKMRWSDGYFVAMSPSVVSSWNSERGRANSSRSLASMMVRVTPSSVTVNRRRWSSVLKWRPSGTLRRKKAVQGKKTYWPILPMRDGSKGVPPLLPPSPNTSN